MARLYTNNYSNTLNGAITNVATTIIVTSATGLPTISGSDTYRLTIDDGTNVEVVEVTDDSSSPTLTVTRGVDGTSGTAFADLTVVELRATAEGLEEAVPYTGEDRAVDLGAAASLEIPNGAAPTVDAAGEIAIDTTITDHTGLITYHDGTEALYAVGMPTGNLSTTDRYQVAYNATNNEFEMVAPAADGITDSAGLELLSFSATGSAVNELTIANAATGNGPVLSATGDNTDVDIVLTPKGTGIVDVASGISFDSGSNTLNEYEEGTWTPVLTFTTPGDVSVSYVNQVGTYTRVGNRVILDMVLTCTPTYTTASGSVQITGAPFTAGATAVGFLRNDTTLSYPASRTWICTQISLGATTFFIQGMGSGAGSTGLSTSQFPTGVQHTVRMSLFYVI